MGRRRSNGGFTLVETILAIALASAMSSLLIQFGWNIIMIGVKTDVSRELSETAQFVGDKLVYEIRNADGIDEDGTLFGENPGALSLDTVGSGDTVRFSVSNETIFIRRGDADPVPLIPDSMRPSLLRFWNHSESSGDSAAVGFELILEERTSGAGRSQEYGGSVSVSGSATIRSH